MAHYVMVGEGKYPIAAVEDCHDEGIQAKSWLGGTYLDFKVPEPIVYDLKEDEYDEVLNVRILSKGLPSLAGRRRRQLAGLSGRHPRLETRDRIQGLQGLQHRRRGVGRGHGASTMMETSDSTLIDADFDRLVLDEAKCNGLLRFRLAENITAIIVDESVKKEIERRVGGVGARSRQDG